MVKSFPDLPSKAPSNEDLIPLLQASHVSSTTTSNNYTTRSPLLGTTTADGSALGTTETSSSNPNNNSIMNHDSDTAVVIDSDEQCTAAGIGTGVLSLLLCGPLVGLLLGWGAYYAARHNPNAVGDAARSMGQASLSVRDHARSWNRKHDLTGRVQSLVSGGGTHRT